MIKFESILSTGCFYDRALSACNELGIAEITAGHFQLFRKAAEWAEQAVLAKLAKQEPVAWLHPNDPTRSITKWQRDAAIKAGGAIEKKSKEIFSLPAYAVNNPSTSDGPLTDEGTKTLKQHRSEFEAWATDEGLNLSRSPLGEYYGDMLTDYAWASWQASKGIKE